MATYSVLTKDAPVSIKVVREGFSYSAFLLGPLWFALRRAWLGVAVWLASVGAIAAFAITSNPPVVAILAALIVFLFLVGLEAPEVYRRSLMRRGYRMADVIESGNQAEAEIRFAVLRLSRSESGAAKPSHRPAPHRAETVGLFLNGT